MIETTRLRIRRFHLGDLGALHALRADPEVMRYIHIASQTREVIAERIANFVRDYEERGFAQWAVEDKSDGCLIGWCGFAFLEQTPEIEIGYGFAEDWWGKGVATEAARACLRYGFERLGFERVVAVAMPENTGSRRVMEKLGMTYVRDDFYWGTHVAYYELQRAGFDHGDHPYKLI